MYVYKEINIQTKREVIVICKFKPRKYGFILL